MPVLWRLAEPFGGGSETGTIQAEVEGEGCLPLLHLSLPNPRFGQSTRDSPIYHRPVLAILVLFCTLDIHLESLVCPFLFHSIRLLVDRIHLK